MPLVVREQPLAPAHRLQLRQVVLRKAARGRGGGGEIDLKLPQQLLPLNVRVIVGHFGGYSTLNRTRDLVFDPRKRLIHILLARSGGLTRPAFQQLHGHWVVYLYKGAHTAHFQKLTRHDLQLVLELVDHDEGGVSGNHGLVLDTARAVGVPQGVERLVEVYGGGRDAANHECLRVPTQGVLENAGELGVSVRHEEFAPFGLISKGADHVAQS
mmetsp:Transcript_3237/g.7013  ORF Transcript_3237/g.7013 Transcript_3237/m.7013 type:complete len:213 (+) Transcript_3237:2589-3227(+)